MADPYPRSKRLNRENLAAALKLQKSILYPEPSTSSRTIGTTTPYIRHIEWSPTGAALASTSGASIRIWEPERSSLPSKTPIAQELKAHTGAVEKVTWNPCRESELASTSSDGTLKIWDLRLGTSTSSAKNTPCVDVKIGDAGLFLAWNPNGREIVVSRRDDVIIAYDVRMGITGSTESLDPRPGKRLQTAQTNQLAFSNAGTEVFATTGDGSVQILDWPSMTLLHTLHAHTSAAYSVAHSPTGDYLAVGGGDSLISLWNTQTWVSERTLSYANGAIHNLGFSFDGMYLCAGSGPDKDMQSGLEISHVETGKSVCTLDTTNAPNIVAWHPLRYWLAYAGDPGGVRVLGVGSSL